MGLALAIDYAVLPTPTSAFVDFIAALADAERDVKSAVAAADAAMDRGERQLRATIAGLNQKLDLAEQAMAAGIPIEAERVLETAEQAERVIRHEHEQVAKTVERIEKLLRKHLPQFARHVRPIVERYHRVAEEYVAEIQHARWRIIAIRADQHRDERGPKFSNPHELSSYLARIGR